MKRIQKEEETKRQPYNGKMAKRETLREIMNNPTTFQVINGVQQVI
jgi:hypothetical protein